MSDDKESNGSVGFEEAADSSGSLDEITLLLSAGVVGSAVVLSVGAEGVCSDEVSEDTTEEVSEDTTDDVSVITSEDTTLLASLEESL